MNTAKDPKTFRTCERPYPAKFIVYRYSLNFSQHGGLVHEGMWHFFAFQAGL